MAHALTRAGRGALAVGPANAEAVLGVNWRWLRDHADALGLTIMRVDGKPFIDAAEAFAAIRRHGTPVALSEPEPEPVTDLDEIRAQIGKRRRCL